MRRSERITMVRGLVLVGVVIVAVSGALVAHAPRGTAPQAHDRVPEDLFWPWAASCGAGIRSPLISFGSDADGRVEVEVGTLDPDAPYGTPLLDETGRPVVDEAASQQVGECLSAHRAAERPRSYRQSTAAERLLLYDWTARWQAPCLRGHGYDFDIPDVTRFQNPHEVWWFLLSTEDWTDSDEFDFESLLEARLACEPMPPFLAAEGVAW